MKEIVLPEIVAVGVHNAQQAGRSKEVTKNRTLSMFELELCIGDGGVSYVDNDSTAITGDLVISGKPGQVRHTRLPFKCYFIHMIVRGGELYDRLQEIPPFVRVEDRQPYEQIFQSLCAHYDTALERDQLLLQSRVLELIYLLCRHAAAQEIRNRSNHADAVERAMRFVRDNLTAELSLARVAEEVSFSPVHFHTCFKKATGVTLREFVEEQRVKNAARLLVETNLTLSEIAYECGFSSQPYFSYVFKKRMSMTPREYVRNAYSRYET